MTKDILTPLLAVIIAVCITLPVTAADMPLRSDRDGRGELVVEIDDAQFLGGDSLPYQFEVFYKIYNAGFEFKKQEDIWVATYDLMITVYDDDGIQRGRFEQQKEIRVASERQTRSTADYRTSLATFNLEEGKYKVNVYLTDVSGAKTASIEYEREIRDLVESVPRMSDVLFAHSATAQGDQPHIFDRGNLLVVPSVSRTYGSASGDRLLFYMELYKGESDEEDVVVETKIRRGGNKMVYRDTLTAHFEGEPLKRQLREISLAEYVPGDYDIEIRLRGRRFKELDERVATFKVVWDQTALIKHDFETALNQLEYIAIKDELDPLKAAQTPEEREAAYEKFWAERDPTPGTKENEVKREFYRRVAFANNNFTVMRRAGWKTDRGRIYIQNGAPDQLDDVPMSPDLPPYQRWHYYQDGRYRRFTFVDDNFDGEYRLVYPYDGLNQRPDF